MTSQGKHTHIHAELTVNAPWTRPTFRAMRIPPASSTSYSGTSIGRYSNGRLYHVMGEQVVVTENEIWQTINLRVGCRRLFVCQRLYAAINVLGTLLTLSPVQIDLHLHSSFVSAGLFTRRRPISHRGKERGRKVGAEKRRIEGE